uniref:RILP-like protein 1 n=1 Tax=Oryzias sinensis TaxID=183150 RepID=A0A8C8DXV3_9TELE
MSALERPAAELTVMDVYDIAAVLGQEFERVIDKFGCECLVGVVPRVVRVLELLEALVNHGAPEQEAEELRREVDRLQRERSDRYEQERRRHQKEIEQVEDVWRGEVQDLLSQITQLQADKRLLVSLSLKESPICEQDPQNPEGSSDRESQMRKKLQDLVDKQRDEIRAKDHQLSQRNEDIEALQMQQHRLINMNQDLLHKVGVMEAKGKTLIQQKTELEAAAQAQQKERAALHMEISKLRKELQERESQRKVTDLEEFPLSRSEMLSPPLPLTNARAMPVSDADTRSKSVLVECSGDLSFIEKCFECDRSLSLQPKSASGGDNVGPFLAADDGPTQLLRCNDAKPTESLDIEDSEKPQFTLQELQDVLQERNELKVQVFMLQEELAYYKSEEFEEDYSSAVAALSAPSQSASLDPPESGIRRLIFTAIMPMVAAGLISDDPTLMPIRRLVSFV